MTEQQLKDNVSKNIANYRRLCNITQFELAEKLNYSDKSVSKWERGEGLPDIVVLSNMAEIFGTTVNDIISQEQPKSAEQKSAKDIHIKKRIVPWLSVGIVWLAASLIFASLKLFNIEFPHMWLTFIYALPVSCIVLTVFSALWWNHKEQILSISGIVWFTVLCVILTAQSLNSFYIILTAAVFQIMVFLWYYMKHKAHK